MKSKVQMIELSVQNWQGNYDTELVNPAIIRRITRAYDFPSSEWKGCTVEVIDMNCVGNCRSFHVSDSYEDVRAMILSKS